MTLHAKIKSLPKSTRPRERLLQEGSESLSSIELLALILGSGIQGKSALVLAQELLAHFGSLPQLLQANIEDLRQIKGLGSAKAAKLKAVCALAQRFNREEVPLCEKVNSALKAYLWVRDLIAFEPIEVFGAILLDARGAAIRWHEISRGTLTQTVLHPREVFHPAIRYLAASLILVHNHPTGDPTPSLEDRQLTLQLLNVSRAMAIPIVDHLIIGKGRYISLKEEGISFPTTKLKAEVPPLRECSSPQSMMSLAS